jgi:hypothetical protein
MTFSVIREIVSFDTLAPYTSPKWAAISPVVRPFAVSAPAPGHLVFFVPEMIVHFRFQSGHQNVLRQPVQQPTRSNELVSLLLGLGQELLR